MALLAALMIGAPQAAQADAATGGGGLFAANTSRIYDTGSGTGGAPSAGLAAGSWYSISVAGVGGIPSTGVSAVQVNFVVTNATSTAGSLHADKGGVTSPNTTVAYVNYPATTTVANAATLAVGSNGKIQVQASTAVNLRVDVQGYYSSGATAAGGYVPLAASVVANTSDGTGGVAVAKVASQSTLTFPVAGSAGVPTDASGVVLNIQESGSASTGGYIIPFGAGQTRPSTALYWPGQRVYNWTTNVSLPSSGGVSIYVAGGPINLTVSVEGYFTANASGSTAGQFTPAATRVYDSRSGSNVALAAGEVRTIQVTGSHGVPDGTGLTSVAVAITVIPAAGATGNVLAYADDASPGPATGYFVANSPMTIFAVVPLGADGGIILQNTSQGTADMVLDVEGWYLGVAQPSVACDGGYSDNSWSSSLPMAPVSCTVSVTTLVNSTLTATVDGVDGDPVSVGYGTTTITVIVPPVAGYHQIWATVVNADGSSAIAGYSFGLSDGAPSATIQAIQNAAPFVLSNLANNQAITGTGGSTAISASTDTTSVTVPTQPTGQVTVSDTGSGVPQGSTVSTGLPFASIAGNAHVEANGIVSYDNGNGTTTVPIVKADGSVSLTTVIAASTSASSFSYPLNLQPGQTAAVDDGGGVDIADASGTSVGYISPAWALDANGLPVSSHFELSGTTVTQVVDLSSPNIVYPVVADPLITAGFWNAPNGAGAYLNLYGYQMKAIAVIALSAAAAANIAACAVAKLPAAIATIAKVICYLAGSAALKAIVKSIQSAWTSSRYASMSCYQTKILGNGKWYSTSTSNCK